MLAHKLEKPKKQAGMEISVKISNFSHNALKNEQEWRLSWLEGK